MVVYIT